jgi:hypothetical protein
MISVVITVLLIVFLIILLMIRANRIAKAIAVEEDMKD